MKYFRWRANGPSETDEIILTKDTTHTQHSKEWEVIICTSFVYVDYGTQL